MAKISAGSYDLNKFLQGGYENDVVSVLYGESGSGKTNLCLIAAVSQAKKGNKVVFVDTEGGFSVERVKQLVGDTAESISAVPQTSGEVRGYKDVLKNIFLLKPTSFKEQKESFVKLLEYLKNEISLIVVDGLTILYRLDFADAREKEKEDAMEADLVNENNLPKKIPGISGMQKVNSELVRQVKILAEISRKQNIPVIVTNQVYKWEDETKMVGGDILKYWSKCHLEVTNDRGKRAIHIKKHRSLKEKSMEFQIIDSGLRKRGWL
jgi:DNA repair protein RadB